MSIVHTFLDSIPSIYLGAPDPNLCELILPGHKLLLEGFGHHGVKLTLIGSFFAVLISTTMIPTFLRTTELLSELLNGKIHYLLISVTLLMVYFSKNKIMSVIIYFASGILGLIIFNLPLNQPLFHLFSGLFGISGLYLSTLEFNKIPAQTTQDKALSNFFLPSVIASIMGYFASFLPGLGTSQVAVISSRLFNFCNESFLVLNGALSTANMLLSLVTLYVLDKARNGSVIALQKLIQVDFNLFILFVLIAIVSSCIATILGLKISKLFCKLIEKVNYKKLVYGIIFLIIAISLILDGPKGILVIICAVPLGIITALSGTPKNLMLGCISLQVIIYFI